MSQAVYHNKWQKNVLQREVGVKLMGVAAAVKKIFAYLLRLKNGTPRGFNIILHTALVCLPFFFIMNKTSSKKVVVQLFSLQNVTRIFFPDLTTFHRKF